MPSKKKGQAKATSSQLDDDALLEQAIAENALLAKQQPSQPTAASAQAKAAGKAKSSKKKSTDKVLTMAESMEKLQGVRIFHIFRLLKDGAKDVVADADGVIAFYVSAADVQAALATLKQADTGTASLGIDHITLDRAFALTQGLMGLQAPGAKTRLHFPQAVVAAEGEAGVPEPLRERMRNAGPYPLFYSEKIIDPKCTPLFFTRSDLAEYWVATGGAADAVPEPTVTDLRVVIGRTLQEPGNWESLRVIPPSEAAPLFQELFARSTKECDMTYGFLSGATRLQVVKHAVAVADGDEPPPLASPAVSVN